ncbi:MAG: YpmS family protein [Lactobacillus sp.]|nr:YpmS family protein [Lactobacillus sp.]
MTPKPKSTPTTKGHNPWKIAFVTLILLLIFAVSFVSIRAFSPMPAQDNQTKLTTENESFSVTFNKKQINGFIHYYLANQLKNETVKYNFTLEKHAVLTGKLYFLNQPVEFSLACDPYVLENGNVQLKARSIAVGRLNLPLTFVMGYISHNFKLPKWVAVDANKQLINLKLNQFKLANGMQFTAKRIDLKQDKIEFNVFLPPVK